MMTVDSKERLRRFHEARETLSKFTKAFRDTADENLKWLYLGKDLIEKVQVWAKDYPDIDLVYYEATYIPSQLVVIIHEYYTDQGKRHLYSNHIIFIPECDRSGEYDGAEPYEIGLHPGQTSELIKALSKDVTK